MHDTFQISAAVEVKANRVALLAALYPIFNPLYIIHHPHGEIERAVRSRIDVNYKIPLITRASNIAINLSLYVALAYPFLLGAFACVFFNIQAGTTTGNQCQKLSFAEIGGTGSQPM